MKIWFITLEDAIKCELRYSHDVTLDIWNGCAPTFAIFLPKPHIKDFADHVLYYVFIIALCQSNEDENTLLCSWDLDTSYSDPRLKYSLDDYSHNFANTKNLWTIIPIFQLNIILINLIKHFVFFQHQININKKDFNLIIQN